MLKVKMYPAGNGDAFLISSEGVNILVDGGYAQTFDKHISVDLHDLSSRGEHLDLLITTHIDADHISGIIRLLSINGCSDSPKIVPIGNIWHNSLRSLTAKIDMKAQPSDQEVLNAVLRRGRPATANDVAEVSARQGNSLASLIHQGKYQWNGGDGTTRISVESIPELTLPNGCVNVLAPNQKKLDSLLKWWKKELRRLGYEGPFGAGDVIDDAFEFMCEYSGKSTETKPVEISANRYVNLESVYVPDASPTNGSSIATVIQFGGVRILMLADAWAEDIVQELRDLKSQGDSMVFDAIKISHHGSSRNTSPELLQLVDAPKYFISSNGKKHGHPDVEVLTAIVDRPAPFSRTIYLNYPTPAADCIRNYQSKSGAVFTVYDNATSWIEIKENTKK